MIATPTRTGFAPERVNYFDSQIISAADMIAEQQYFLQKMRRHNRFLHGWGVVAGLEVSAAPTPDEPGRVRIDCGYALSPQGDEIYVPEAFCFDLLRCGLGTVSDPCEPGITTTVRPAKESLRLYIAVRYTECSTRPVRIHPSGCGCDTSGCAYSRIRDDYAVECLLELPASHRPQQAPTLCDLRQARQVPACPPCPEEPWVVIAAVNWNPNRAIVDADLNNLARRQVYSTAMLQAQAIDCCCERQPPPPTTLTPATVQNVQPANNTVFTAVNAPHFVAVTFDKALIGQTVNANTISVIFQAPKIPEQLVEGDVIYEEAANVARFTPRQPFSRLIQFGSLVSLTVRVSGSSAAPIRDVDNLILDGDKDGNEGGDFTSRFQIRGAAG